MSCNEKQWEIGIGSVADVSSHHVRSLVNLGEPSDEIDALSRLLSVSTHSPEQERAIRAVLVAYLSKPFRTTGRLYHLTDTGMTNERFVMSDSERDLMANLLDL